MTYRLGQRMIKKIKAKNFKSLKEVSIDCSNINIFIGKPNTGKSNILEIIGFLSHLHHGNLEDFVRYEVYSDIFYDEEIDNEIMLTYDDTSFEIGYIDDNLSYKYYNGKEWKNMGRSIDRSKFIQLRRYASVYKDLFEKFKFYQFKHMKDFPNIQSNYLHPPYGNNLSSIILTNNYIKNLVSDIFQKFGYRLIIEQPARKIKILKEQKNIFILFPYSSTADTIQNLIFYLAAIHTNNESVIAFNEPEAKAFPYYIKQLAESIALDNNNNQYFITTHNPYFLISILEKSKKKDINIYITYLKDYETKIKKLTNNQKSDILENALDPFFNIDKYILK